MEPQQKQPVLTLLDDRPVTLYLLYLQRRLVLLGRGMKDKKQRKKKNSLIMFCHPFFESFLYVLANVSVFYMKTQ
jgi:hypothetical protein